MSSVLDGKQIVVLGERDGIAGPAIRACVEAAGASVAFSATECFVWTASGAMDLQSQAEVKRLAEAHGSDSVVVVLGAPDPESAEIAAETVVVGDPTYAGPLAEAQLGLPVFHILEDEIRALVPDAVWDEQIGVMADVLDGSAIAEAVGKFRQPADG